MATKKEAKATKTVEEPKKSDIELLQEEQAKVYQSILDKINGK